MLEELVLNGVDLNDNATLTLSEVSFKPAEARPQWADNPNADGAVLVQEPHYTDSIFELTVRIKQASSADVALERLGELIDAVQECARHEGGVAVEWTPKDTTTTYTAYAKLGELLEVPTEADGDLAGWLLKSPVAKIRLTCRPFLYTEDRTALASKESGAEPQQVVYVEVEGDVLAEAELIVTDKSSQDRRYFRVGRDVVEAEVGNPSTLITAASLTTTGFSGEAKTRSGAYSEEKVKRATAVSQATTMCGTGAIEHIGPYRVFARVYAASEAARYRISYKNGDGPLIDVPNPGWVQPQAPEAFCDLDLGEVTFDEAVNGEQRSEIRVEVKSSTGEPIELDLNYLELYPSTGGFFRARGLANNNPTKLLAYDTFLQTEGALAGKTLPVGGTWAGAGDTDDFTVIAAQDYARRTAKEDADETTGRFALAGSSELTTSKASVDCLAVETGSGGSGTARAGVFLRYGSTTKYIGAFLTPTSSVSVSYKLIVKGYNGSALPVFTAEVRLPYPSLFLTDMRVALAVDTSGVWKAWAYDASAGSEPAPLLEGQSSLLATGGALEKGKGGFYDANISSLTYSRNYDNFNLLEGDPAGRVAYSGRTCRLTSDGFTRQDSTGAYEGQASIARGANLYLQPGLNRLVIAARRTDADAEPAANVTDKISSEVVVRERVLAPR